MNHTVDPNALEVLKMTADALKDGKIDKAEAFELMHAIRIAAKFENEHVTAEAGEEYAAKHYDASYAPPCTEGTDLIGRDGTRIQVKTRKLANGTVDGIYFKDNFDIMSIVLHEKGKFIGIIEFTHDEFFEIARWRADRKQYSWSIGKAYKNKVKENGKTQGLIV